jgi:hypothetical protein
LKNRGYRRNASGVKNKKHIVARRKKVRIRSKRHV